MRRFFEGQIDNLYRAWLETGGLGSFASRPDYQIGWLFQERAALEARILDRAAEMAPDVPTRRQGGYRTDALACPRRPDISKSGTFREEERGP
jgi:hypothetical protein